MGAYLFCHGNGGLGMKMGTGTEGGCPPSMPEPVPIFYAVEDEIGWQRSRIGRLLAPCENPLRSMKNQKGNVPMALRLEKGSGRVNE